METTSTPTKQAETKYCFSYIRFSSKKQELGSSLERQEPIAERVARELGWQYMPKWNAKNLGVSAYKGDNRKTLESICEAAKAGKIPQGSVMILECLDRATRLPLDDAQDLIKKILRSGIEIFTDTNKRHLTRKSLNDVTAVIVTAVELDAAYQYSAKLSMRSTGGFTKLIKKAETGEKVYFGGMMPSFIKGVKNGDWVVDHRRLEIVKKIFREYIGGKAMNRIANEFNQENIPSLINSTGKLWAPFTLKSILRNPAYTGDFTYRGKTFQNYLPAVVGRDDFKKVRYLLGKNSDKRGGSPTGKVNSIFNGIGKCICGASMVVVNSTRGKHHYSYYFCSAARAHACKKNTQGHLMKTNEVESHFLRNFLQDSPSGFIAKHTPQAIDESIGIKIQIADIDKFIGTAGELIRSGTAINVIKAQLDQWETEKKALEHQLQAVSVKMMANSQYPTVVKTIEELIGKTITTESGKAFKIAHISIKMSQETLMAKRIEAALLDSGTRMKLKAILPLVVKEIRCDTTRNGYSVINHDGNESPFMSLAK